MQKKQKIHNPEGLVNPVLRAGIITEIQSVFPSKNNKESLMFACVGVGNFIPSLLSGKCIDLLSSVIKSVSGCGQKAQALFSAEGDLAYPVVGNFCRALNYKDLCNSDFMKQQIQKIHQIFKNCPVSHISKPEYSPNEEVTYIVNGFASQEIIIYDHKKYNKDDVLSDRENWVLSCKYEKNSYLSFRKPIVSYWYKPNEFTFSLHVHVLVPGSSYKEFREYIMANALKTLGEKITCRKVPWKRKSLIDSPESVMKCVLYMNKLNILVPQSHLRYSSKQSIPRPYTSFPVIGEVKNHLNNLHKMVHFSNIRKKYPKYKKMAKEVADKRLSEKASLMSFERRERINKYKLGEITEQKPLGLKELYYKALEGLSEVSEVPGKREINNFLRKLISEECIGKLFNIGLNISYLPYHRAIWKPAYVFPPLH